MFEQLPKHFPLTGTVGDSFFTRQQDEYSCGPASLTTVCSIYGTDADYQAIRTVLDPDPDAGTAPEALAGFASRILPVEGAGDRSYAGGIAIANVMLDGEGHYVVFLAREENNALYYDPYYHELVLDDINNIEWSKGKTTPRDQWAANFAPRENNTIANWLKYAKPAAPAALIMPPSARQKPPAPPGGQL